MSKPGTEVLVDWLKGYTFLGSDASGRSVVFDAGDGGTPRGMTPMDALLCSLGACSGMDVVAFLGKRKQQLTGLRVSVSGLRPEFGYPKPFTSITVKFAVTGKSLEKKYVDEAVKGSMEKYCSVVWTVNGKAKVDYTCEILEG